MYIDFVTPWYRFTLEYDLAHNVTHVLMFTFGCLFWWPMVCGADRLPNQPSLRTRYAVMGIGTALEVLLGALVIARSTTIAPEHTLSDTHTGGYIFLIGSLVISAVATAVMVGQSARQRRKRLDRVPVVATVLVGGAVDPALD